MKQEYPQKKTFFEILDKVVRTTDKSSRRKQKSQRTPG